MQAPVGPLTRRRAAAFAAALDGDAPAAPGLAALLDVATRIPRAPLSIDPVAREAIRRRVLEAVPEPRTAPEPVRDRRSRQTGARLPWLSAPAWRPRLAVLTAAAALVALVAGLWIGAGRSLPGQPLFNLKQAAEAVQLHFAGGVLARARLETEFAATRTRELRALAGSSQASAARYDLRTLVAESQAAGRDVAAAAKTTRSRSGWLLLDRFAVSEQQALTGLAPRLPLGTTSALTSALAELRGLAGEARAQLGAVPALRGVTTPSLLPGAPASTLRPGRRSGGTPGTGTGGAVVPSSAPTGATGSRPSGATSGVAPSASSNRAPAGQAPSLQAPSLPLPTLTPSSVLPLPLPTVQVPTLQVPTLQVPTLLPSLGSLSGLGSIGQSLP